MGKTNRPFQIYVDGSQLKQTDGFVYLGGCIHSVDGSEADVSRRVGLARGIFQSLNKIWDSKELRKATKIQVYESLVLSVLLYNSETWTLKEENRLIGS